MLVNPLHDRLQIEPRHVILLLAEREDALIAFVTPAEEVKIRIAVLTAHFLIHRQADDVVVEVYVVKVGKKMQGDRLAAAVDDVHGVIRRQTEHIKAIEIAARAAQTDVQPRRAQADDRIHGGRGRKLFSDTDQIFIVFHLFRGSSLD